MIVVRAVECDINRSSSICSSVNRDLAVEGAIVGVCLALRRALPHQYAILLLLSIHYNIARALFWSNISTV